MTFTAKVGVAFVAVLSLALLVGLAAVLAVREIIAANNAIVETSVEAIVHYRRMQVAQERCVLAIRGYLGTRDPAFLAAMQSARGEFAAHLDNQRFTEHDPYAKAIVDDIGRAFTRCDEAGHLLVERAGAGISRQELNRLFETEMYPREEILADLLIAYGEYKEDKLEHAQHRASRAVTMASWLVGGITGVALLLAAILGWILTKTLGKLYREARDQAERVRLLLDTAPEGIVGLDNDGKCTFANPAVLALLGLPDSSGLLGRHVHDVIHHTKSNGQPFSPSQCAILRSIGEGTTIHSDEETIWRIDGTSFPAECWARPLKRDGRVQGAVLTLVDISERRHLDEARRQAEVVKAREEFLSIASHDLRSPLTSIRLKVQGLVRRLERAGIAAMPVEQLIDSLAAVDRQCGRMVALIEQLLTRSHAVEGKLEPRREEVDLVQLAKEVVDRHQDQIEAAGCRLQVTAEERAISGQWDRGLLDQVISNLLANALKFGKGQPIEIAISRSGRDARIAVRDHGVGVAVEDQERIFARFGTGTGTGTGIGMRRPGGHGLGLWIVRLILEAHGGSIAVASKLGEGATFTATIPRGDGKE
ncbi:MAG: ATP-binding protein [Pseudomonadota bacterium]